MSATLDQFRWQAVGRRKTSVARVYLTPGTGKWDVNGRTLGDYFPRPSLVQHIQQSFTTTDTLGAFDVRAIVNGGGQTGPGGRAAPRHRAGAGGGRRPAPHEAAGRGPDDARSARRRAQEAGPCRRPEAVPVQQALVDWAAGDGRPPRGMFPRITHIAGGRPGCPEPECGPRGRQGEDPAADERDGRSTPTKEGRTTPHVAASAPGPARSRCPFRAPDPPLEPEDAPVHLRRTFRHLHHRPPEDAPPDRQGAGAPAWRGAEGRERALRLHEEAAQGRRPAGRRQLRRVLRHRALARRHAHQLRDDQEADPPVAGARAGRVGRRFRELHQEGKAALRA